MACVAVKDIKSTATESCAISFAAEAPFLAAGARSGTGGTPWLRILSTAPGLYPENSALLDDPVLELCGSPAAFSRVCWSSPMGTGFSSCPTGLIAGGLVSGEVAVWDPEALREKRELATYEVSVPWMSSDSEILKDYCAPENQRDLPVPASPPLLHQTSENLLAADLIHLDNGPIALFANHTGSVRGLAFSPSFPNLLASGGEKGRIMVCDLAKLSADTFPTWQAESTDGEAISSLSWSPRLPNIMGSTSSGGFSIWDVSSRSPISVGKFPRECSGVEFSPVNDNTLVVSRGDHVDAPALLVWDLRHMEKPLSEMCKKSKGVAAMALSPHEDTLLVSTNSNWLSLWSLAKQEMIWPRLLLSRCHDVQWSMSTRGAFAAAFDKKLSLYRLMN